MWKLKRYDTNELIYITETDLENELNSYQRARVGEGIDWALGLRYTHYYI